MSTTYENTIDEFNGKVCHGDGNGKTLGFPTANLNDCDHKLEIANVYLGNTILNGNSYNMVMCVNWSNVPEIHILDYQGPDFYGQNIHVKVIKKIRKMESISSMELLKNAIQNDVNYTIEYFKSKK